MDALRADWNGPVKRADLHCHTRASTEADEAVLNALRCPESYSQPEAVYRQARRRGMDFITITDHDTLTGAQELAHYSDVFVGVELTCYFPEDGCKIHLLLWGLAPDQHDALQAVSTDIYRVAAYVHEHLIAHAVAHPLYRQNGKLERWHVERLLLLFKGFECLNGAHSMLHRTAFEPLLDTLDEGAIRRLERTHSLSPLGREPWRKARTAGSDDHGLLNVGRTWTEFPADVRYPADVLACLRAGRCRPGGEAGSSIKLAHNFYGVGLRYLTNEHVGPRDPRQALLSRLVGDGEKPSLLQTAMLACRTFLGSATAQLRPTPPRGTRLLGQILLASAKNRLADHPPLANALREGHAPLAEHEAMFSLVSGVSRDVSTGIAQAIQETIDGGEFGGLFDTIAAVLAHQAMLGPYYFALFHQNQERHLLARLTGQTAPPRLNDLRIGLFTDRFGGDAAAGAFAVRAADAAAVGRIDLSVLSCGATSAGPSSPNHRRFEPLIANALPGLPVPLDIPPLLDVLEHADRCQFDVIVINTPGPMALCAYLVARMLRVPIVFVCHNDLQAEVQRVTDFRTGALAGNYVSWLASSAARTLVPTEQVRDALLRAGVDTSRIAKPGATDDLADLWAECLAVTTAAQQATGSGAAVPPRPAYQPTPSSRLTAEVFS